jgi:hypothetical protein
MKSSIELSFPTSPGSTASQVAAPPAHGEALTSDVEEPASNLAVALAEVRYHTETKTASPGETFDRFDRFQYRFWGINE